MKYKCVIFDFGRVLGNFDHMITCNKLAKYSSFESKEIYEKIFKSGIEKEFDEGDSFENFYQKVKKSIEASEQLTQEKFGVIWGDIFSENKDIEKVLEKLNKKQIPIFILSNTNSVHWKYIKKIPVIKKYFSNPNQLILSFEIGKRKPDLKIFIEGIKRTGYKPQEIVYIDDVEEYINTFIELGGKGIIYNCQTDSTQEIQEKIN